MSVEVLGVAGDVDGYGDSMAAFRDSHEQNTRVLLNLAAGRKKNAPLPAFNPQHPDNAWPVMVYHPERGEKTIGVNLLGLVGGPRQQAERDNKAALAQAQKDGYRAEPYVKPQIVVLDPALEKAAMKATNDALQGQIIAQADELAKLRSAVEKLLGAK